MNDLFDIEKKKKDFFENEDEYSQGLKDIQNRDTGSLDDLFKDDYDPIKQREGIEGRIKKEGIDDPEEIKDERGFVRKAFNTNPESGKLMSAFEVLGRPQQALFNTMKEEEGLKSAWEGFSGQAEIVRFKEILHGWGMDETERGEGLFGSAIGVDSALGFAGDLILDPINIPMFPVSVKAKAGVSAKRNISRSVFGGGLQVSDNLRLATPLQKMGLGVKKGLKTSAEKSDLAIEKMLSILDAKKQGRIALETGASVEGLKETLTSVKKYGTMKKKINSLFSLNKAVGTKQADVLRSTKKRGRESAKKIELATKEQYKIIDETASKMGQKTEFVDKNFMAFHEYSDYKPASKLGDLFDPANPNRSKVYISADGKRGLKEKLVGEYGFRAEDFEGMFSQTQINNKNVFIIDAKGTEKFKNIIGENGGPFVNIDTGDVLEEFTKIKNKSGKIIPKAKNESKRVLLEEGNLIVTEGRVTGFSKSNGLPEMTQYRKNIIRKQMDSALSMIDDKETYTIFIDGNQEVVVGRFTDAGETILTRYDGQIVSNIDDLALTRGQVNTIVQNNFNKIETEKMARLKKNFDNIQIPEERFYSDADIKFFEGLKADENFMKGYNESWNLFDEMLKEVGNIFGMDLENVRRKGYIRHVRSDFYKNIPNKVKEAITNASKGKSGMLSDVASEKLRGRKFRMSAEKANEIFSENIKELIKDGSLSDPDVIEFLKKYSEQDMIKIFKEDAVSSMYDQLSVLTEVGQEYRVSNQITIKSMLKENDLIIFDGSNKANTLDTLGFKKVRKADFERVLESHSRFAPIGEEDVWKEVLEELANETSENLLVEPNFFKFIEKGLDQDIAVNSIVKIFENAVGWFKGLKMFSPGMHVRNTVGNISLVYQSGTPMTPFLKNGKKARNILDNGQSLYVKRMKMGIEALTKEERKSLNIYENFLREGFDMGSMTADTQAAMERVRKANINQGEGQKMGIKRILDLNISANAAADKQIRMQTYLTALENPDIYLTQNIDTAENFVRYAMFDPSDLTQFENSVMRKIMPFYTWQSKNIAFQVKNAFNNPQQAVKLSRTIDAMWDFTDIDTEDVRNYRKENFWIPIPFMGEDGEYTMLRSTLPMADLGLVADPSGAGLSRMTGMSNPLLSAPFELSTNSVSFSGMPIEDFKGQESHRFPEMRGRTAYIIEQSGLDMPYAITRGAILDARKLLGYEDEARRGPRDSVLGTVVDNDDVQSVRETKAYQDLEVLRGYLRKRRQQGTPVKNVSEIEREKARQRDATRRKIQELRMKSRGQ